VERGRARVLAVTTMPLKPRRPAVLRIGGDGNHPKAFDYGEASVAHLELRSGRHGRTESRSVTPWPPVVW